MARLLLVQSLWHEFPGLMAISAVAKARGHRVDVLINRSPKAIARQVARRRPDVVGLSVMLGTIDWSRKVSREIKARTAAPVIWGGFYPTVHPEVVEDPGIDMICRGEGEYAVTDLLDAIETGGPITGIGNLWVKDAQGTVHRNKLRPLVNLNDLPPSDRDLYGDHPFFEMMPTVVAIDRYCPNGCTFCCQPMIQKVFRSEGIEYLSRDRRYYSKIDPDRVIAEILAIKDSESYRRKKNKLIYFGSDNTNGDHAWFMEFFTKYRDQVRLPFFCSLCLNSFDEDEARILAEANCQIVGCGIETGNEALRTGVLGKRLTDDEIIRAAELMEKYGLFRMSGNMLGIPGETLDQAFETVALHRKIRSKGVVVFICQPYAGSAIERYAIRQGFLSPDGVPERLTTFHDASPFDQPEIRHIENLHKIFLVVMRAPASLDGVFRWIVKLPPNPVFDLVFLATHGTLYMKKLHNLGLWASAKFVAHHIPNVLDFMSRG